MTDEKVEKFVDKLTGFDKNATIVALYGIAGGMIEHANNGKANCPQCAASHQHAATTASLVFSQYQLDQLEAFVKRQKEKNAK